MTTTDAKSKSPVDEAVNTNIGCSDCGYNLRGLSLGGSCPECGRSIAHSISDQLEYANVGWLESVARGASLFAVASVLAAGQHLLFLFVGVLQAPFYFFGVLCLTRKERRMSFIAEGVDWQKTARWAALVYACAAVVSVSQFRDVTLSGAFGNWFVFIAIASWAFAYVVVLVLARRLALRMRRASLAAATTVLIWCFGVHAVMWAIVSARSSLVHATELSEWNIVSRFAAWISVAFYGAFMMYWLFLEHCLRKEAERAKRLKVTAVA